MARRVRTLYDWSGGALQRIGAISEARLRAWEYYEESGREWEYACGAFRDTVHAYKTTRPDLRVPEWLFVGDHEEKVAG